MTNTFDRDFLGRIAGAYQVVRDNRVAVLMNVAAAFDGPEPNDGRLQQNYIDAALKLGPNEFETVLRETLMDPNAPLTDRAGAATLYVRGNELKLWRMLPRVGRIARSLIRTGNANKASVNEIRQDRRAAKRLFGDYLYVQSLADKAELTAARKPIDLDALGAALKQYLDALQRYFPASYEMQTAHLRRTLAPAVAKTYVELVKCHDHQERIA